MFKELMTGTNLIYLWLFLLIATSIFTGVITGFFRARKIQSKGFEWQTFRREIFFATINLVVTTLVLGALTAKLQSLGWISFHHGQTSWWRVGVEYAAYFFFFDTYFYWVHRLIHIEPMYRWIHKLHHLTLTPNVLTPLSMSPIEALLEGLVVPIFVTLLSIHDATMALITPTAIIMGVYVHSGHEFMPRWWNKSWATKWFITATFHDQHHRYFVGNFGGYTTIWDRICGTMRARFEADFEKAALRRQKTGSLAVNPAE